MGFFDFLKPKQNNRMNDTFAQMNATWFPKGEKDIKYAVNELLYILDNKIDNSEEILLIIISYCLTNKTIIETWNITKIINISKMLINKEISEDTNFLLSSVKHMSICSIKQSIETFFKV